MKVCYLSEYDGKYHYGIVDRIDDPPKSIIDPPLVVWARWDNDNHLGWMPLDQVEVVEE